MKIIFFLKNAKSKPNDKNSLVLRYYLKSTKKYKVKGLGISLSKRDWNQEDQKVKRTCKDYQLYNRRLSNIEKLLEELESEKGSENINYKDIDIIVESAIKGQSLKEYIDESEHIINIINKKQEDLTTNNNANEYVKKYDSLKKLVKNLESKHDFIWTLNYHNNNIHDLKNRIYKYSTDKGNSDQYLKNTLNYFNIAVNSYNDRNNKLIRTFNLKSLEIRNKVIKDNVYFTNYEVTLLFDFATDDHIDQDIKYLRYYLLRCFCGIRIGDMTSDNFNPDRIKDLFLKKSIKLWTGKKRKVVTIPVIKTYLFRLLSLLNWEFPEWTNENNIKYYGKLEKEAVSSYYNNLIKSPRKIEVITNGKIGYRPISDYLTTHTARKTFAMIIYNETKSVLTVKNMLSHSTTEVTQRYLGIEDNYDKFENLNFDL
jgi:hypothetical protein